MARFLFACQPAAGHLNPLLSIAERLRVEGHEVLFMTYAAERVAAAVEGRGFRLVRLRMEPGSVSLAALPAFRGFAELAMAAEGMFAGLAGYARQTMEVIERERPDVVVSDMAFRGPHLAAERCGLPHAVAWIAGLSLPGPDVPPFGSGLPIGTPRSEWPRWLASLSDTLMKRVDGRVRRARRSLGLPAAEPDLPSTAGPRGFGAVPARWLNLTLTAEALEAPRDPPPKSTFFVGPCLPPRDPAAGEAFWSAVDEAAGSTVYVSMGTVFNRRAEVFRRIVEALSHTSAARIIVSAGASFESLRSARLPESVHVFAYVPQGEVLRRVDVVVSHGGNNTVNETLAAGRPLLVMPVGGEQGDNASRVVHLGAGLRAETRKATPDEIAEKVERLLCQPSFSERARAIADAIRETDGPGVAARLLARLATVPEPLRRPPGYPLTVGSETPMPWEWTAS